MPHNLWSILRASLFMLTALSISAHAAESTPSSPRVEPLNSSQISRAFADAAGTVSRPQTEPQNSSQSQARGEDRKISAGGGAVNEPAYEGSDLSVPAYAAESALSSPWTEPLNSSQISRVFADAARTSSSSQAEPQNGSESQARGKAWKISAGIGPIYRPAYEGSDNYEMIPLPDITVEYEKGLFFMNIWDGVGSYPLRGENYKAGASVGVSWGRRESDDRDNLRGMGDIEIGPTANLLGEYRLGPVRLSGKITAGTEDYGVTAQGRLGTMFPVARQFMLMGSVSATWADQEHMETYFGVSSAQSARSGYRRHHMDSGMKSVGFTAGVFYAVTDLWNVKLVVGGEQLVGHAADSPITKNAFNPYVLLTQVYKF